MQSYLEILEYTRIANCEDELNEGKNVNKFKISVKFVVDAMDIDEKGCLLLALQKKYGGFSDIVILPNTFGNIELKNTDPELKLIKAIYGEEIYEVKYNQEFDLEFDTEDDIFNYVSKLIKDVKFVTYRSEYKMDKVQKSKLVVKSIKHLN